MPEPVMRFVLVLGLFCLYRPTAIAVEQPITVSFDGVRQVAVSIGGDRDEYEVIVRMKPVQCFDNTTNERLNFQKARSYGLQGLLKHLSGDSEKIRASVSGFTVTSTEYDGEFFRQTFRLPRDGINIVRTADASQPSQKIQTRSLTEEIRIESTLFSSFGDHSATIAALTAAFEQELEPIMAMPLDDGNDFEIAIVELEERMTAWFTQLELDVRADKLLLVTEQSELSSDMTTVRDRSLHMLRNAVERREKDRTEKALDAQFPDVNIEADFEVYLKSNRLLMEISGAKVIRRKDGSSVVIAVASTVLKDSSAEERLRAEKVCRLKALTNVLAERNGVQIAHVEELKDETIVVVKNGAEKATSIMDLLKITKAKVEGITHDMPVIGRWRSAAGGTFYLAIGAVIDRDGKPIHTVAQ